VGGTGTLGLGTGGAGTPADWTGGGASPADFTGDGVHDLLVKLPQASPDGNVAVLVGPGDGSPYDTATAIPVSLARVDGTPGPQPVDQVAACPTVSVSGSPLPDLYVIIGDVLYLYTPGFPPGAYNAPDIIGSGWANRTITCTAAGADPALLARDKTTGRLDLHTGDTAQGVPAAAAGRPVTTYASSGYSAASTPAVQTADLNADGRPDVWSTTTNLRLNARLATSTGTLGQAVTSPLHNPIDAVAASVDGDAYSDILGITPAGVMNVYTNTRASEGIPYSTGRFIGEGWNMFSRAVTADIDGDGYLDILGVKPDGTMWLYPNARAAADGYPYQTSSYFGFGWNMYSHILAGDVNRDGYSDIIGVTPTGDMWLYPNAYAQSSTSPFPERRQIGVGWNMYAKIYLADTNGDGYSDLLGVTSGGDMWLYTNDSANTGTTSYLDRRKIGEGWTMYSFIYIADTNGDHYSDILGIAPNGEMWLYGNTRVGDTGLPYNTRTYYGYGWNMYVNVI
jgi:hypothetical protein